MIWMSPFLGRHRTDHTGCSQAQGLERFLHEPVLCAWHKMLSTKSPLVTPFKISSRRKLLRKWPTSSFTYSFSLHTDQNAPFSLSQAYPGWRTHISRVGSQSAPYLEWCIWIRPLNLRTPAYQTSAEDSFPVLSSAQHWLWKGSFSTLRRKEERHQALDLTFISLWACQLTNQKTKRQHIILLNRHNTHTHTLSQNIFWLLASKKASSTMSIVGQTSSSETKEKPE